MAKALDQPPGRMTVDKFVSWAMARPEDRFALVNGAVVAMVPERALHARLKARIWRAFYDQIRGRGVPCEPLPDCMAVKIDEHTAYEPDALVHCTPAAGRRHSDRAGPGDRRRACSDMPATYRHRIRAGRAGHA
jgi:Uma2 family endonuclease